MELESVVDFESLRSASGRFKNVPQAVCTALLAVASEMSRLGGVVQSKPNYSDLTAAIASKTTKQDLASMADATLQRVQSIVDMSTAAREDLRVSTAADLRSMHERIASLEQTVSTLSAQLAHATARLQEKVRRFLSHCSHTTHLHSIPDSSSPRRLTRATWPSTPQWTHCTARQTAAAWRLH